MRKIGNATPKCVSIVQEERIEEKWNLPYSVRLQEGFRSFQETLKHYGYSFFLSRISWENNLMNILITVLHARFLIPDMLTSPLGKNLCVDFHCEATKQPSLSPGGHNQPSPSARGGPQKGIDKANVFFVRILHKFSFSLPKSRSRCSTFIFSTKKLDSTQHFTYMFKFSGL